MIVRIGPIKAFDDRDAIRTGTDMPITDRRRELWQVRARFERGCVDDDVIISKTVKFAEVESFHWRFVIFTMVSVGCLYRRTKST